MVTGSLLYYYRNSYNSNVLKLSEITAQFIAEKIKEDLYLGEYNFLDLSNIPSNVERIAIWDRNGILRTYRPQDVDPPKSPSQTETIKTQRIGNSVEIYIPIFYKSTFVGTVWISYKL
jgi:hypothetical protein